MKVGRTSEKEISTLRQVLNECEWLSKELRSHLSAGEATEADFAEFEVFGKHIRTDTAENMFSDLIQYLAGIHFQRILMNCEVLLEQTTDPELKHLDFSPDIKQGLDLLESKRNVDEMIEAMAN